MTDDIDVTYIEMTDEEKEEWARVYAQLILDLVEQELGYLPPPPSKKEFDRLWKKMTNKI